MPLSYVPVPTTDALLEFVVVVVVELLLDLLLSRNPREHRERDEEQLRADVLLSRMNPPSMRNFGW